MVTGMFNVCKRVDGNVIDAINHWLHHDLDPGSYCMALLTGQYELALDSLAHALIKQNEDIHWSHVAYVEDILHGQHGFRAAVKLAKLRGVR